MEPFLDQMSDQSLLLDGNRFHCNCENIWFRQWVIDKELPGIICSSPVANTDMRTIDETVMTCTNPNITGIKGSTDYGTVAEGSGAVLLVPVNVSIMLQCTGKSDPAPTLQWSFPPSIPDEVVVEPNINRTDIMTTSYYKLKGIRSDQSGQYRCNALNKVNRTEAFIQVIVDENMTIPVPTVAVPIATTTSTVKPILILVAVIVAVIILLILAVIYLRVNKEYHYDVAEAERLNESTSAAAADDSKQNAELLHVDAENNERVAPPRGRAQTQL